MPAYPDHDTLAKAHILALLLFVVVAVDVTLGGPLQSTDPKVTAWAVEVTDEGSRAFARDVLAAPGHTEVALILLGMGVGFCLWLGVSRNAWFMLFPAVAGMLLVPALKLAFHRARPSTIIETGAFPSGHVVKAVFVIGLVLALSWDAFVRRKRGFVGVEPRSWWPRLLVGLWLFGAVVTIIGRVFGLVHWWTDTLGAALLGLVMLTATLFLHATLPEAAREEETDELIAGR